MRFKNKSLSPSNIACSFLLSECIIQRRKHTNIYMSFQTQGGKTLHFLIFAENQLLQNFNDKLSDFELLPLQFLPNGEWKTLFKPCAAQRLFLPVKNLSSL